MNEVKIFEQKDLVLKVSPVYNPEKLDLSAWQPFINKLCTDRPFQMDAINSVITYLAGGRYNSLKDLATENYNSNFKLQEKYSSLDALHRTLQLQNKLYATIDLATGTGKSYVIYGIAQIMLGIGLVDRVLVLCPSLTIESGLKEKFDFLSGDAALKKLIPESAAIKNPRIIDANQTIRKGDVCVENIHAVYENTGSSIGDSLRGIGEHVLVLNDEAHHIFNKTSGNTAEEKSIKKWKEFLMNPEYGFHYIVGLTGTAYIDDDYFTDVIFRYSIRNAIESHIVKNVDYVKEDDSQGDFEKFQKIYQNHLKNAEKYSLIKPITIMVTRDIARAKALYEDVVEFLMAQEHKAKPEIEKKVIIVTSHKEHRGNIPKLKYVDDKNDPIEWIVSVSMLTEGWDVKNVFQIVPMEEKAFNSKLLVAQVLGRGLRVPSEYKLPQPKVVVFNHKSWSSKIKKLIDEVLEIEKRIYSTVLTDGDRASYHFNIFNIGSVNDPVEVTYESESKTMDFSRLLSEGIVLESQEIIVTKETEYESVLGGQYRNRNYSIENPTSTIDEVLDKLYGEFEDREWEGKALKLGEDEYTQNNLPPRDVIRKIIELSMEKRGNKGELIVERNVHKILSAFATMLRKKNKSLITRSQYGETEIISTKKLERQSVGIGSLRRGATVFYSDEWENEIIDAEQVMIMNEVIADLTLPRAAIMKLSPFYLKTPVSLVITNFEPERKFIELLCKPENAKNITAWVKSRDRNFYEIQYSFKLGSAESKTRKHSHANFNPDFFIIINKESVKYVLVIEVKDDDADSIENRAKYKYGVEHFKQLNNRLEGQGVNERYLFHFLSPGGYQTFFSHLKDGTVLESQEKYRCALEILLEQNGV